MTRFVLVGACVLSVLGCTKDPAPPMVPRFDSGPPGVDSGPITPDAGIDAPMRGVAHLVLEPAELVAAAGLDEIVRGDFTAVFIDADGTRTVIDAAAAVFEL